MDRHHTATAGSAAEASEVEIIDDPDFAVEVGKTNESRVASLRGLHQEEGCDKKPQNTMVRNSSEQGGASPTQHAAASCPQQERRDSGSSGSAN